MKFVAGRVKGRSGHVRRVRGSGRTAEYHQAQLRAVLGFREPVPGDDDKLADWPAAESCPAEPNRDRLRLALPARCRQERTEPPGPSRIERIAGTGEALCERRFTVRTAAIPAPGAVYRLEKLITASDPDDDAAGGFLRELKADPGPPVTRVSARCSMGASAGHGPGRG